jgi:hypothetical protein
VYADIHEKYWDSTVSASTWATPCIEPVGGETTLAWSRSVKDAALQRHSYQHLLSRAGSTVANCHSAMASTHVIDVFVRGAVTIVTGVAMPLCPGSQISGDLSHDNPPTGTFRASVKAVSYLQKRPPRWAVI